MSGPSYAPAYRPQPQQHLLHPRLRSGVKRRYETSLERESSPDPSSSSSEHEVLSSIRHPVNSTDPYHVAGYAREDLLPAAPFPHAPIHTGRRSRLNLQKELSQLQPPILTLAGQENKAFTSLKHRHLDNLTAILHSRILKQDWVRASRTFGLLIRTDVSDGVDIRQHNRWTLAGEILLHRDQTDSSPHPEITEVACRSAREFYERMILNYPYSQRLRHKVTEAAIYPVLFNVWIYEVQQRSQRARQQSTSVNLQEPFSDYEVSIEDHKPAFEPDATLLARRIELEDASEISSRLDRLVASPPFDDDAQLLLLRATLGLWIADICKILIAHAGEGSDHHNELEHDEWQNRVLEETAISKELFAKYDKLSG